MKIVYGIMVVVSLALAAGFAAFASYLDGGLWFICACIWSTGLILLFRADRLKAELEVWEEKIRRLKETRR